jgi:hypothetical protein
MSRLRVLFAVVILTVFGYAQDGTIRPNDALILENIPPVPASIAEQADRYTQYRTASMWSWLPQRREILIGTRFADTNQVHSVAMPGGARTQLTFFGDRGKNLKSSRAKEQFPKREALHLPVRNFFTRWAASVQGWGVRKEEVSLRVKVLIIFSLLAVFVTAQTPLPNNGDSSRVFIASGFAMQSDLLHPAATDAPVRVVGTMNGTTWVLLNFTVHNFGKASVSSFTYGISTAPATACTSSVMPTAWLTQEVKANIPPSGELQVDAPESFRENDASPKLAALARETHTQAVVVTVGIVSVRFADGTVWREANVEQTHRWDDGKRETSLPCHAPSDAEIKAGCAGKAPDWTAKIRDARLASPTPPPEGGVCTVACVFTIFPIRCQLIWVGWDYSCNSGPCPYPLDNCPYTWCGTACIPLPP